MATTKKYTKKTNTEKFHELDQKLTERFLSEIKAGNFGRWIQEFSSQAIVNGVTGIGYNGCNVINFALENSASGVFMTYLQAKSLGLRPVKGCHAIPGVRYVNIIKKDTVKTEDIKDPDEKAKQLDLFIDDGSENSLGSEITTEAVTKVRTFLIPSFFSVFKLEDLTGNDEKIKELKEKYKMKEIKHVEKVPAWLKKIENGLSKTDGLKIFEDASDSPYYQPGTHSVHMHKLGHFKTVNAYVSTFLHELAHSTSKNIVKRKNGFFGDPAYAFEELIAELAAAMTCQRFGIECTATDENSKAYIAGWSTCCTEHIDALRKAAEISSKIADVFCNFVKPKTAA